MAALKGKRAVAPVSKRGRLPKGDAGARTLSDAEGGLARARAMTMRLLDALESQAEAGGPPCAMLFGEKETHISALVKLVQTLIRLIELEHSLAGGEKRQGFAPETLKAEDVAILKRYVEGL